MPLLLPPEIERYVADAITLPGVVLAGAAAMAAWGLPVLGAPRGPLIAVASTRSRARPGGLVPLRADLGEGDVIEVDGIPVMSPLRTLVHMAPLLTRPAAVAAMDEALHRHLVSAEELAAAAAAARGPGAGALQRAVRLADARAQSPFESISRVAVVEAGWAPVLPQHALEGDPHHFDLGLVWARVVGECQSREFHGEWVDVCRDYGHSLVVAQHRGHALVPWIWRDMWPDPEPGLLKLLTVLIEQPGQRCRRLRARHLGSDGVLRLTPST